MRRWLWKSFVLTAIIPLLAIELTFLAIFWGSNELVHSRNVEAVSDISNRFLDDIAYREAAAISDNLAAISRETELFSRQALRALEGDHQPPAAEKARYAQSPEGVYYTQYDNGLTSAFCSGVTPVGPDERQKLWRLSALDQFMKDLRKTNKNVASIYINTRETCNRMHPYVNVLKHFPPNTDVTRLHFYYLADGRHNPERKAVWTDAYLDPAGHGWMVSSIAPVWKDNRLEAVVGLDITLQQAIDTLLALKLPWDAYPLLVDRNGRIVVISPRGEKDFGLRELTSYSYSRAVQTDTFKPEEFDLALRRDTRALGEAMRAQPAGHTLVEFRGELHQASFATISGPEWRLVIIAPTATILKEADALKLQLRTVSYFMIGGLFVFYILYFLLLHARARDMSMHIAAPIEAIAEVMARIGRGEYWQRFGGSAVRELDDLGHQLISTGQRLGQAHERIVRQDLDVTRALVRQRQAKEEQVRFVRVISHELRTPLSVIDSGAQIVTMRAGQITGEDLRSRMNKLRRAVQRISQLLHKLVDLNNFDADANETELGPVELGALVSVLATSLVPADRLELAVAEVADGLAAVTDGAAVSFALRATLDNALLYSDPGTPVRVSLKVDGDHAAIEVSNCGQGIEEEEIAQIGEKYFRGMSARGTEGAGISLHLARKLIERIGGKITIHSRPALTILTIAVPLGTRLTQSPVDLGTEGRS